MGHYFYITPEEYETAENKGINKKVIEQRVRDLGWTKVRALNTPVRKFTNRDYWSKVAEKNGIRYSTFVNRVIRSGWDEEKAATRPTMTKKEIGLLVKNSISKKGD